MNSRYAESQGWKVEVMESSPAQMGGVKELSRLSGQESLFQLNMKAVSIVCSASPPRKRKAASTRQPPPRRPSRSRRNRHQNRSKDLRIDTFCSSGPGGQSVNTTYSAVPHPPTAHRASSSSHRTKIPDSKPRKGHARSAFSPLRNWNSKSSKAAIGAERRGRSKPATAPKKSAPITIPKNRVTDHRIGLTIHHKTEVMDGKLAPLVDGLVEHYEAARLSKN